MVVGQICKHEGCGRPMKARRMCLRCYEKWRRANPAMTTMELTKRTVIELLPATRPELLAATGSCHRTINRATDALMEDGKLHIGDWVAPGVKGGQWLAVYVAGPGDNVKLTARTKLRHHVAGKSIANARLHARRQTARNLQAVPAGASWAATLLIGANNTNEAEP